MLSLLIVFTVSIIKTCDENAEMHWQNGFTYLPLKPGLGDGEVAVAPPRPLAPVVGDHGVQPAQRAPGLAATHLLHRNLAT